jgi:LuxR family transcriptional regulator, maltose regulon positive regulatory protein
MVHGREAARQAAGDRLPYAQQGRRGAGPGIQAAEPHRWNADPVPSAASLRRSRGGLEVVPRGYRAARGGSGLADHHPRETPAALAPRTHLLWAAAFLLLEAIADDAPGDLDAPAPAVDRDLGLAEPDRVLFPALIRVALGLLERRAGPGPTEAGLVSDLAGLLGEVTRSAPASAGPPSGPGEPLTHSEVRVLRYLPTHMGTPEIAAELYLSANTVKTHLRHLYRKLGAHTRREAVQRARAIGLLTAPSRTP